MQAVPCCSAYIMAELPQSSTLNNSTVNNITAVSTNTWTGQATVAAPTNIGNSTANAWTSSNSVQMTSPAAVSGVTPPSARVGLVASSSSTAPALTPASASAIPTASVSATASQNLALGVQPAVLCTPATTSMSAAVASVSSHVLQGSPGRAALRPTTGVDPTKVLDKQRLVELVREVDPMEQLDDDVEDLLVQITDDFIDSVVNSAAQLAKHRKSSNVEVKDVQMHLERSWNMWIPGFGSSEEPKPYKKTATTEAHKQRLALIKKTLKKY